MRALAGSRAAKRITTTLAILLALPGVVYLVPQTVGADGSFVVLSGSMVPFFDPGDVILVERVDPASLEVGDVVTFTASPRSKMLITHRVIEVVEDGGKLRYRTQGDANEDPDPFIVHQEMVVGKYRGQIPAWGHLLNFIHSKAGYVLLILLPGLAIVLREGVKLYHVLDAADRARQAAKAPLPWDAPGWAPAWWQAPEEPFPWERVDRDVEPRANDPFPWELPDWQRPPA